MEQIAPFFWFLVVAGGALVLGVVFVWGVRQSRRAPNDPVTRQVREDATKRNYDEANKT